MNTRAKLPPPRSEEAAGYPPAREAPVTLPVGERPVDLRADPFLTCRAEAALSRGAAANEPNSGRNKSGLTRTAQDAARVEIMWPHHRVWRGTQPVSYGSLSPWEFVFGYLSIIKEMDRSEYVLSTMLRTLYNFATACTKHDWACMREAFQIVLLEIESGNLSWADVGPINLILKQAIIDIVARPAEDKDNKGRHVQKADNNNNNNTGSAKRKPRTCTKFQKGLCSEPSSHYLGRYYYHHACANCLKSTSELVSHSASSCSRSGATQPPPPSKNPTGATGGV